MSRFDAGRQAVDLPDAVAALLRQLAAGLRTGRLPEGLAEAIVAALAALPARDGLRADRALRDRLGQGRATDPPRRRDDLAAAMAEAPAALAWILLFHPDGRLRAAALSYLTGAAPGAFLAAALVGRLNDWAPPVRAAAVGAVGRCLSVTEPAVLADAVAAVLVPAANWRRWGDERAALQAIVARPDVAPLLVERIRAAPTGTHPRLLAVALRSPGLDDHLAMLSQDAVLPSVRALALRTLLARRAIWPIGWRSEWIDRRFGRARQVPVFAERPVVHELSIRDLALLGLADRAATVRKIAADAVIEARGAFDDLPALAERLCADRNAAVRMRGDFLRRHLPG